MGTALDEVRRAAAHVEAAERELARARASFWRTLAAAHAAGTSLTALGRELGVSRQRVRQMIDRAGEGGEG